MIDLLGLFALSAASGQLGPMFSPTADGGVMLFPIDLAVTPRSSVSPAPRRVAVPGERLTFPVVASATQSVNGALSTVLEMGIIRG